MIGSTSDVVSDALSSLSDDDQLALYVARDLDADTLSEDTALAADQAAAFLESLPDTPCSLGSGGDVTLVVADLTGDATLEDSAIADMQIYHDSGFGCNEGDDEGHFRAEIEVYDPGEIGVESVVITSSDTDALGGDGAHTLSQDNGSTRYVSQTSDSGATGVCVAFGEEVSYTITVTMADDSELTQTVTRNHPRVPEADTTVDGEETSNNIDDPDVLTTARPVYTWESPDEKLAQITDAPEGSVVKYTYEFSHVDGSSDQTSPLNNCGMESSGALYSVDSFMPTVDCDVAACAAASGVAAENVICRMNIQTFLVDEYDRYLGQAAGHFPVFCVDTNGDGDCGE